MGLIELPDFLEVMAPRLDYVKIFPDDVINSPRDWFVRKIATYLEYSVTPYLDHGYFRMLWENGKIEEGIAAGAEFGIKAMEFTQNASAEPNSYTPLMMSVGIINNDNTPPARMAYLAAAA